MKTKKIFKSLLLSFIIIICGFNLGMIGPQQVYAQSTSQTAISNTIVVQEGADYATQVLKNPWDMDTIENVSHDLNDDNRTIMITNFSVNNGIFTGTAYKTAPYWYALFQGFPTNQMGKDGALNPIDSTKYHCVYMRERVYSTRSDHYDHWAVLWDNIDPAFSDGYGMSDWQPLHYPWDPNSLPDGNWQLYSIDLNKVKIIAGTPWNSHTQWKGLRIYPTTNAGAHFDVDWVRLTDCQPVNVSLSWSAVSGQIGLWAGIGAKQKDFPISKISSTINSYTWDVQGLQPGSYYFGVESSNGAMTWLPTVVEVNTAPYVEFRNPSPTAGTDYATSTGNPWDIHSDDVVKADCARYTFQDSKLIVDTDYPAITPGNCLGSGDHEADPKIFLHLPSGYIKRSEQYRYFTFSQSIDGTVQQPMDGMIVRLIWENTEPDGRVCSEVSKEIPLELGSHVYTLDLMDPILGVATAAGLGCPVESWSQANVIGAIRVDPNENWTDNLTPAMVFHQVFDWFKLTKMETVAQGNLYSIRYKVSKSQDTMRSVVYYTIDRTNPKQNVANIYKDTNTGGTPFTVNAYNIFLPNIMANNFEPGVLSLNWNTKGVSLGNYYICIEENDGLNSTITCSDAQVSVIQ